MNWHAVLYLWVTWVLGMAAGIIAAAGADVETRFSLTILGFLFGFLWTMNMVRGEGK